MCFSIAAFETNHRRWRCFRAGHLCDLRDNLKLTLGAKLEYSSYTGLDVLPNMRLGWAVTDQTFLWAAVSRAVRTPSRLDRDLTAPVLLAPSPNFESEKLIAYELGYRGRPTPQTSLSISLYYNVYQDLRITGYSATPGYVYQLLNAEEGNTHGLEAWGDWSVLSWWRLGTGLNLEHKDLHVEPGFVDISAGRVGGFRSWLSGDAAVVDGPAACDRTGCRHALYRAI